MTPSRPQPDNHPRSPRPTGDHKWNSRADRPISHAPGTAPQPEDQSQAAATQRGGSRLSNRLVGILHGCLKTGTVYNEHTAWSHHSQAAA